MDREVVHALLGLLDERVAEELPRQVLGRAADLLERLVDRDRPDGDRRVAQDPLARLVDVLARREVHDRVRAPADGPRQLLDLLGDARRDRRVAHVGVDLDQEVAADGHRLQLRVVDVGRDDGAPAGDLVAHELGRDDLRDGGAEAVARRAAGTAPGSVSRSASSRWFSRMATNSISGVTMPLPGVVHLRHRLARPRRGGAWTCSKRRCSVAASAARSRPNALVQARQLLGVAALVDPRAADAAAGPRAGRSVASGSVYGPEQS